MAYVEPLNLTTNIVQLFAGSEFVFIMIAILFILYFAAKSRMSLIAALPMVVFVVIIIGSETYLAGSIRPLFEIILLIAALAAAMTIQKIVDR